MKRLLAGFVFVLAANILYSEGLSEGINEAAKTSNPHMFSMIDGAKLGQELFIEVITRMEKNGETNYDIEYIVNNYVDYVASHTYLKQYNTTYDWMSFVRDNNILSFHYAFDTFFNLMENYLYRKKSLHYYDEDDEDDY